MLTEVKTYRLPDSVKKEFIEYAISLGEIVNPYANSYQQKGFPEDPYPITFRTKIAAHFRRMLERVPKTLLKEHSQAQAILQELEAQKAGGGSEAFIIENLPIDPHLPATPQKPEEKPVNNKETYVSEAIHEALLISMGQQPYRQRGMEGGIEITPVIPMPNNAHEQSSKGKDVLALHTEISPAKDEETPYVQSLLGLRGGIDVPVSQTVITTLVPVDNILSRLSKDEIDILKMPIFHFSSGPAIVPGEGIKRIAPIVTVNEKGQSEMRLHADPARMQVVADEPVIAGKAQELLAKLRKTCDVLTHPDLNASAVRIDPGIGLFWHNKRMLHGRGDIKTLLDNACNGEAHSTELTKQLFPNCNPQKLRDEYQREKKLEKEGLAGAGKDPNARWLQRKRGIPDPAAGRSVL